MEVSALWEQEQLRLPATRLSCERTNHSFPHGGPVLLTNLMKQSAPLKVGGACRFPRALTDSILLTLSNNFQTRQTSLRVACSARWPRCQVSIIPPSLCLTLPRYFWLAGSNSCLFAASHISLNLILKQAHWLGFYLFSWRFHWSEPKSVPFSTSHTETMAHCGL